ncbi:MAG: hypothetical protein AB7T59_18520 [Hyphomonadaceae bacterium]
MTSALPWALVALMFVTSAWAFTQTPDNARFPMQWGIRGDVNWRAPRAIALLFSPILAAAVIGLIFWLAGPQGERLGWLPSAISAVFLITHGVYLYFALRETNGRSG